MDTSLERAPNSTYQELHTYLYIPSALDTEKSSLLSQLSTILQLDTEESSLLSQTTRYLTLFSGTIVLPVTVLMSVVILRLHRQSQSKGQYLCEGYITPYTIIPSLTRAVPVSRNQTGRKAKQSAGLVPGKSMKTTTISYKMS